MDRRFPLLGVTADIEGGLTELLDLGVIREQVRNLCHGRSQERGWGAGIEGEYEFSVALPLLATRAEPLDVL